MNRGKYQVAVIGCGRMGVKYIEAFSTYHDCEVEAIVDPHGERRLAACERFGIGDSFPDTRSMLSEFVPDIVSVVTPTKYIPDNVIACAEAGVQAISAEKPITARLSDGDAMLEACKENNVVFSGGFLQRAKNEVQHAARLIREGKIGELKGACLILAGELSGGGVQSISVMRLFTDAEVVSAIGWIDPPEAAHSAEDICSARGVLRLSTGINCSVFSGPSDKGVQVWGTEGMVSWKWNVPQVFIGFEDDGSRQEIVPEYSPYDYSEFDYLTGALRGMIQNLETGARLPISGYDLCQAVEIVIALKESAKFGNVDLRLPLKDRSLTLMPVPYRWLGGDATGGKYPDEAGRKLPDWTQEQK